LSRKLEDSYSKQKRPKEFIFGYRLEQLAQQLYNRNIFKKLQLQLKATSRLNYRKMKMGKHLRCGKKVTRFRRFIGLGDIQ